MAENKPDQSINRARVEKSDEEWRSQLSENEYYITRQAGTEPAFSGIYNDTKTPGVYRCKCCDTPLFDSTTKYDSGSGWPSFFAPIDEGAVATHEDLSLGMRRLEVLCATCDAHLGHVFPRRTEPDGLKILHELSVALTRPRGRRRHGQADRLTVIQVGRIPRCILE